MTSGSSDIFVAYASSSPLRAEAMREAARALEQRGIRTRTWEDLQVEGHIIVFDICAAIDESRAVLLDVSTLNDNVFFEVGYSLGKNKLLWLALDETDTDALKAWNDISLLSTIGRFNYSGNGQKLANLVAEKGLEIEPTLLDFLLTDAKPRETNAVFAPALPMRTTAASLLERFLDRQRHLKVLGAGDDLGLAPLQFYAQEISRSSAAIFHLLSPTRVRAAEHNARASMLAGYAQALRLPVLLVAETGYEPPIDLRDILFVYDTSASLQGKVSTWLATLPKDPLSGRRLGRIPLDVELPIRSFGQYVAEYESNELGDYFVDTNEFREILDDTHKVFIGRKGTGKTATMSQAVAELRRDRRNLVVPVKPSSYELSGLMDALKRIDGDPNIDHFLVNLWTYLIYSEVAIRTISHASETPAGLGGSPELVRLVEEMDALSIDQAVDMSSRLESLVLSLLETQPSEARITKDDIANHLRVQHIARLGSAIRDALHDYDRVAVIIDNLDKTWERGADYRLMSKFLLSLLHTSGRLEANFAKNSKGSPAINLSLSIFLRTDIYDVMAEVAREPDKIGALSIHWRDPELLVRVLEERFIAKQGKSSRSPSSLWTDVFCPEVRGVPTRDYFLWRVLPRPRDIIYLANASLTTAINRRHEIVHEDDIVFGETQYSKFALEALLVESEAQGWDLEEVLFNFAGLDSTLEEALLDELLVVPHQPDVDLKMWLLRTSFLGVETGVGEFTHIEGETEARRKLRVADRMSRKSGTPRRFRVHPAFRRHLDVRDDDLHEPTIQDVTLA